MASEIKLKQRQHRSRPEWSVLVEESRKSGMPVRKFCAARGISVCALYKWRSRLGCKDQSQQLGVSAASGKITKINSAFVPVKILPDEFSRSKVPEPLSRIKSCFILQSAGGVKIEFPSGCTGAELRLVSDVLSC